MRGRGEKEENETALSCMKLTRKDKLYLDYRRRTVYTQKKNQRRSHRGISEGFLSQASSSRSPMPDKKEDWGLGRRSC